MLYLFRVVAWTVRFLCLLPLLLIALVFAIVGGACVNVGTFIQDINEFFMERFPDFDVYKEWKEGQKKS